MRSTPILVATAAGLVLGVIATAGIVTAVNGARDEADAVGRNEIAANGSVQGELYPGDPIAEADLIEWEDLRLLDIAKVAATAPWRIGDISGGFRLATWNGSSLVDNLILPARDEPWQVADLLALSPDAFVELADKEYLLSENIVVLEGATLLIDSAAARSVKLESTGERFVSIVALGGSLTLAGQPAAPVTITSWNPVTGRVDTRTDDGRSYIRVIDGNASIDSSRLADLGFWSGNTGGLALTGSGSLLSAENATSVAPGMQAAAAGLGGAGQAILQPDAAAVSAALAEARDATSVSAEITDLDVDGNAFGLFVTNADDIQVVDSTITRSLVDGLVLHRAVTGATIRRTVSTANAVDGIAIGRSSADVRLIDTTASGNGRNGLSIDGRPLADGPNAVGTTVAVYGDTRVDGGRFDDNARYGVEVTGGVGITVSRGEISGNEVGVVVSEGAENVTVSRNALSDNTRQGIVVRRSSSDVAVADNSLSGGDTGVLVRDSAATVTGNDLLRIANHGISLVGVVDGAVVSGNSVAGFGSTAIWSEQSTGGVVSENRLREWRPAPTLERVTRSVLQPLTLVWLTLGLLVVVTAALGKRASGVRNPFADHVPLTSLTRGIVSRDALGDR